MEARDGAGRAGAACPVGELPRSPDPQIRRSAFEMPLAISGGMANIDGLPELLTDALEDKLNYPIKTIYSQEKNSHMTAAIGALMLCEAAVG